MAQRRYSSLLELEAADYFKLDPAQVQMFNKPVSRRPSPIRRPEISKKSAKPADSLTSNQVRVARSKLKLQDESRQDRKRRVKTEPAKNGYRRNSPGYLNRVPGDVLGPNHNRLEGNSGETNELEPRRHKKETHSVMATSPYLADSSTASTNSLPSISSSPSVSPSLVCPHLSLDDILRRQNSSKSPHTIGLCDRCRTDPPPNAHSPLSPAFKPSSSSRTVKSDHCVRSIPLTRGYSDQQVGVRSQGRTAVRPHEDSLDYYLEPSELRRLQMSPTLRNSVEFIRKNPTEAGRVLRIFKNSEPFEKPLRICVSRGEFATLNNLLDYISSRQLVPSGARYLFHLDGQLVYSVNELKHGSIYIVSGTRKFDHKTNSIIKEQHKQELQSPQFQKRKVTNQPDAARSSSSLTDLHKLDMKPANTAEVAISQSLKSHPSKENMNQATTRRRNDSDAVKHAHGADSARNSTVRKLNSRPAIPTNKNEQATPSYTRQKSLVSAKRDEQRRTNDSAKRSDSVSKSNESMMKEQVAMERPVSLVRAKSELGSAPNKRRKNVTFVDTNWAADQENMAQSERYLNRMGLAGDIDSKVAKNVSDAKEATAEPTDTNLKALNTSEIGIQVSDSIDGFLIDLPLPMPLKGEEAEEKRSYLRKGQGARSLRGQPTPAIRKNVDNLAKAKGSKQTSSKSRRQVVTITERQLSLDEMDQLKDLDHGDHHSEAHKIQHVTITLDGAEDLVASDDEAQSAKKASAADSSKPVVANPSETTGMNQLEKVQPRSADGSQVPEPIDNNATGWQYPGGSQSSATPTERPISQSEANESVHARVTTPTPSLSTIGGDSLSMSHDSLITGGGPIGERSELSAKKSVPVCGKLCGGTDPPGSNFTLRWVNGFSINDQYPDNSTISSAHVTDLGQPDSDGLLTPSQSQKGASSATQFKPSERFHNWICYSRRHDELVYPAGNLVVLWCKGTNEQRYYSKHVASVCCIALGSVDDNLAASGQLGEPGEKIVAAVHLWSLVSLETLRVVSDEQFIGKRILSLKVRNTTEDGCELSVSVKAEKRVWVYVLYMDLKSSADGDEKAVRDIQSSPGKSIATMMKASKPLQAGQIPLLLVKVSNQKDRVTVPIDSTKQPLDDLLITFGRRHFQVWFSDRKQRKLRLLLVDRKNPHLIDLVAHANCLARISPVEYLIGDVTGNITLLMVNTLIKPSSKFNMSSKLASEDRYSVDMVPLHVASLDTSLKRTNSITCLTRISGSIFASGDSTCTVKFWLIDRKSKFDASDLESSGSSTTICQLLNSISLPQDLGFICAIILSKYNRKQSVVEFYVISTSNAILYGSVQLHNGPSNPALAGSVLANSSFSVIYEGHETFAINLVADCAPPKASKHHSPTSNSIYFTCSLDYKICKWSGKNLIWKSMLPSACASMAVHPIGFVLAVGSADGTVYILDKISGLLISYFPLTPVCINCLAYSRDGTLLAAGCANGSIFMLPVYERGLKYKKVSIFQSPNPVVSLQFSTDNQYILTSVRNGPYQELILWDLPNFRYMRDYVKTIADKISWFDAICSGSEDVRAIWENANLAGVQSPADLTPSKARFKSRRLLNVGANSISDLTDAIVNLSCHRLIRTGRKENSPQQAGSGEDLAIASDTRGCLRLFRYPCYDIQQGFYELRVSLSPVNCCRFLSSAKTAKEQAMFVSTSLDGSICLWSIE